MDYEKLVENYIEEQSKKGLPVIFYSWYFEGTPKEDARIFLTVQDVLENIVLMTYETERPSDIELLQPALELFFETNSLAEIGNLIIEKLSFMKEKKKKKE